MSNDLSSAYEYTDSRGLQGLKTAARERTPEALRETARQFEALFLQQMLKAMREASPASESDLMESEQTRFYRGLFDQQIALNLSQGQGLGLADMIQRQLGAPVQATTEQGSVEQAALTAPARYPGVGLRPMPAARALSNDTPVSKPADAPWPPKTPAAFVRGVWPHAQRAADALGVAPEVLVAQSALETGWGSRIVNGGADKGFNLFGIKADARWQGEAIEAHTQEYRDGVAVHERAGFRAYHSIAQSFDDYVDFLKSNPRYEAVLDKVGDAKAFVHGLQQAGYATDPAYARKIQNILGGASFQGLIDGLKNLVDPPM